MFHKRSKYIDNKYYWLREKVPEEVVNLVYVKSDEQFANIFTKGLAYSKFIQLVHRVIKLTTTRQKRRRTKHLFDWMAHAHNLSKGASMHLREGQLRWDFCGLPKTQQHINVACKHPVLAEVRRMHWRHINEFLQCYWHQHLSSGKRWIALLLDCIKDHLWSDTEVSGDI